MVRTVERIEQELALLDQSVATIAQEFHDAYSQYLTALGQAIRQQLILASYHLCTHGYPERFLELSLAQKQQLQHALRQLAKQAQSQLLDCLQPIQSASERSRSSTSDSISEADSSEPPIASLLMTSDELTGDDLRTIHPAVSIDEVLDQSLAFSQDRDLSGLNLSSDLSAIAPANMPENAPSDLFSTLNSTMPSGEQLEQPLESSAADLSSDRSLNPESSETDPADSAPPPIHPKDLVHWQEAIEENIVEELQNLSHAANRLLQQANVLPNRLPEPVLEVAAKADLTSEVTVSPPNLLNLLIETETDAEKEATMTQLMAIRLRLSEIEFSDSLLMVGRSKIRELSAQLNKLGREYQKKQKEHAIAQAESAWRASWYED